MLIKSNSTKYGGLPMALTKYSKPNTDLFGTRFSDIIDEFFNDAVATRQSTFSPSIDISETDKQFMIEAELPGMEKKDINLNLENGRLTISGERKFEKKEDGKKFHRVETHYGSFTRSFQLPDNVDDNSINATYNNGILNVIINKSEQKAGKKIQIK
jgi:HSP20 family protein